MIDEVSMDSGSEKKDWVITQEAFNKLLTCFNPDHEIAAKEYERIYKTLLRFFEHRGCFIPDESADKTIDRVVKRIDEGEKIRDINNYFYGVARNILKEYLEAYSNKGIDSQFVPISIVERSEDSEEMKWLRKCLEELSSEDRDLIIGYYQGEKKEKRDQRKNLVEQLGTNQNAMRVRIHRIKVQLKECCHKYLKTGKKM
jgi:RNA polymerase sigma factor (sigma-70 family)